MTKEELFYEVFTNRKKCKATITGTDNACTGYIVCASHKADGDISFLLNNNNVRLHALLSECEIEVEKVLK